MYCDGRAGWYACEGPREWWMCGLHPRVDAVEAAPVRDRRERVEQAAEGLAALGPSPRRAPPVTVVVPAYNAAESLPSCLGSLFAQTFPRDHFEIILVDDGSTDGTATVASAMAAAWEGRLRVVEKRNGGPASARNAGLRAASGEIVAFTDADCVADPDWLERLVAALAADPETAGVGGPILNPPASSRVAAFLASTGFYRHRVRRGSVDYLLTANAAFRRAALESVSGFCEREGAWGEDADLSFRLRRRGYTLAVTARGGVTHHGAPPSARGLVRELYRYGYGSSLLSRNWRNGRAPAVELARHGAAAILAPALALQHVRRVGLRTAASFIPLFALEHGAFVAGLACGEGRQLARWARGVGSAAGHGGMGEIAEAGESLGRFALETMGDRRDKENESPAGKRVGEELNASSLPLVSVLMPVRNEAGWIARSLGAVLAQDYPPDRLETLVIDGESDDETLAVARALPGAERVRFLRNPARLQAAGLNLGLREARGAVVVRVDGHTVIAPDYVRSCVAALEATGAANVGGRMAPAGITPTGAAIALATGSRFGVPTAFHRSDRALTRAQETDTVYLGAWPRAVLERLGGFDESLPVNEDYELNYRIRRAGGRILLVPAIRSTYYGRQSFGALARQYYGYGAGKAEMLRRRPGSLRPRQLVAPAFVAVLPVGPVLGLAESIAGAWLGGRRAARLARLARLAWLVVLGAYVGLNLVATRRAIRRAPAAVTFRVAMRVPLAFGIVHLAWGAGFWAGLFASWRRRRASRTSIIAAPGPTLGRPGGRRRR